MTNLTDEEIEKLAQELAPRLKEKIIEDFYQDLGHGVWALVKRGLFWVLIIIAGYGAYRGH